MSSNFHKRQFQKKLAVKILGNELKCNAKALAVPESAYLRCIPCISLEATLNPSRFLSLRILVTSACIGDKSLMTRILDVLMRVE